MATPKAVLMTDVQEDAYFSDIFSDESDLSAEMTLMTSELEAGDFVAVGASANEDLWDILDISADEWDELQAEGFFIP